MDTVVQHIQAFNQQRNPRLLQLKYQAMRTSAFAFLRGTCHLFYADWPITSPLNDAPAVWLCGDLHWQNLGSYKGDNRLVFFGVNDFDESVLGPCTWDLARFLVSILVSAPILSIKDGDAMRLCTTFLDAYVKEMRKDRVRLVEQDATTGLVKELLFQVKTRSRKELLDGYTELVGSMRELQITGKHATAVNEQERVAVTDFMKRWAAGQHNPDFFKVVDIAHRIAGVGSLGIDRYVILIEGMGSPDRNYLLDLKAEATSSLQPYLVSPQPTWSSQSERIVTIERWFQGIPPALLTAVELNGASYVLRELQPDEDKMNLTLAKGRMRRLEKAMKVAAKVIAWGQLRSGGHLGSVAAFELASDVHAVQWHDPLLEYAQEYKTRVEDDYETFCTAYDSGVFSLDAALHT